MKRHAPTPDDPYVTEERLCIIEDGCKNEHGQPIDRRRAEQLHRERLDELAKRGTTVEMFG